MKCFTFQYGKIIPGIFVSNGNILLGGSEKDKGDLLCKVPVDKDVDVENGFIHDAFFKKEKEKIIVSTKKQNAIIVRFITYDRVSCPDQGRIRTEYGMVFRDRSGVMRNCSDVLMTMFDNSVVVVSGNNIDQYLVRFFKEEISVFCHLAAYKP